MHIYISICYNVAERSEEASRALAAKRELQARVEQINKDFEEEKSMTFEITQDMTRQYKGMQEELLARINKLEETVQDMNDKFGKISESFIYIYYTICIYNI